MKKLDLSHIAPLDTLIQFTVEGDYIDLHNDFDCTKIDTDPFNRIIIFHFESAKAYYLLCFFNADAFQIQYDVLSPSNGKGLCIDRFSRVIALESQKGEWFDLPQDRKYYAVDFVEGLEMVIEAEKALLLESDFKQLQTKRIFEEQLASISLRLQSIHKELADIENHDQKETKLFLQNREQHRRAITLLEQEQAQKQKQLADIIQQEQLLLTLASRNAS